jgi:hypothetical protein
MGVLSLLVKLGLDASAFEMGVKRAQSVGEKFGNSFKSAVTSKLAGALSVAAIGAFTKNVIQAADQISDLSEQLNLTTDQVQRLQILAGETGVTFDKFGSVLSKFEQIRLKATSGDEDAIKTLKALGFTTEQLYDSQISTIDGAIKVAEAYKNSGRSAETTAAMTELYGLKLKAAGAALADYNTTSNRTLISKDDVDVLAKANTLLDEQLRIIKALAAPGIAAGVTATAEALKGITQPTESFTDRAQRAVRRAERRIELQKSDEFLARKTQEAVAADRTQKFGGPNPPPIGSPEFETVKGPRFSLGGGQDPLARIGGFTGFQSAQDTAIKQAIEQTLQLRQIVKNTGKTAENTRD